MVGVADLHRQAQAFFGGATRRSILRPVALEICIAADVQA
jgi:hypothetical protein